MILLIGHYVVMLYDLTYRTLCSNVVCPYL